MENNYRICVVVPIYNRLETTRSFINNFRKANYKNYEIVIVDDGNDNAYRLIKNEYSDVHMIKSSGNEWWSGATNIGVEYAIRNNFDYVLTINNDATVNQDFLDKMLEVAKHNSGCIIGARIMNGTINKIWSIGVHVDFKHHPFLKLGKFGEIYNKRYFESKEIVVDALPGNGVLVPVDIYKRIGLYDAKNCPQYHGDTEFTYRASRQGVLCVVALDAVLFNNEYESDPKLGIWRGLTSKKSPYYWRATLSFYQKYASFLEKLFYFKQFVWIPKQILSKFI